MRFAIAFAVLAVATAPTAANAGAAVMATVLHMFFGNVVIAAVEIAVLLACRARTSLVLLVLPANYLSCWIGVLVLRALPVRMFGEDPLASAVPASLAIGVAFVLLSMLIEWPAFRLCYRGRTAPWKKAAAAVVAANLASNALLAWYYSGVWRSSLVDETARAPAAEIAAEAAAHPAAAGQIPWIYAFSPDRDAVVRVRLDGAGRETLLRLEPGAAGEFLLARPNAEGAWDLWFDPALWLERSDEAWQSGEPESPAVAGSDAERLPGVGAAVSTFGDEGPWFVQPYYSVTRCWSAPADLRPAGDRQVTIRTTWEGLRGLQIEGLPGLRSLALDNPLLARSMVPLCATILPGDVVVFELNHENGHRPHGIYALSLRSRTIAHLGEGTSPVVVYERPVDGWRPHWELRASDASE